MMVSAYFSQRQLNGLLKAGDIVLPGTEASPSFSETGCIQHIDRMARYLSKEDLSGLQLLLLIFNYVPGWIIGIILKLCQNHDTFPGIFGTGLRMIEIGVKGIILSPYYANLSSPSYSGKKVYDIIGWNPTFIVKEDSMLQQPSQVNLDHPAAQDIKDIYTLSKKVQPEIKDLGIKKRLEMITNLKALILGHQEVILDRIQQDTGKSRFDAITAEIFGVLDFLDYLGKNAVKMLSDRKVPTPFALIGKKSKIFFEPLGTALLISPWNYPFYQAIVPICQAFIAGNAVIFKPSKATPLKGLIEELLQKAGFSPGWIQVVYGKGSAIGDALIDEKPDKIFLIGSIPVGKRIMKRAARHLIPVELELGGKDPMIIFEDVHIERAVAGAIWGAFTTTGQSCTSVERLFIHEDIYGAFKKQLVKETLKLTQGTDRDGSRDIGAMTTRAQIEEIARQVNDAKKKGAVFLTGETWDGESGFIPPMIIEGVTKEMRIDQAENFGPLLPIYSFSSEAEAIEKSNDPVYGLSASVWTDDLYRADRVARSIYTGNVSINNVMLTEGNHALPFGGVRKSGFGRYKGEFGFYAFSNIKSILIDKNSKKMEANWFPYTPEKYALFSNLIRALYSKSGIFSYIKGAFHGLKLESYVSKLYK